MSQASLWHRLLAVNLGDNYDILLRHNQQFHIERLTAGFTCSPPSVTRVIHNLATVASQVDAGLGKAPTTRNETCRA